ncbi:MAG: sugar phosphate nucleotidyltransferase [Thermodesulforhabdaceae bacterium]|jgi:mannose-1-phosphate guanylyltransferase
MIRHALILSAGWGTRLRPLTFFRPKALVPLGRKSLLEYWLSRLGALDRVFVNVHALAPFFSEYLKDIGIRYPSLKMLYESRILGSGGTILKVCENLNNEWILTVNVDSFLSSGIDDLIQRAMPDSPSICLFLKDEPAYNNVVVAPDGSVRSIRRRHLTQEEISKGFRVLAYVGVQIIHSEIITEYISNHAGDVLRRLRTDPFLDIMEVYNSMIQQNLLVRYFELTGGMWCDIGTIDSYMRLCLEVSGGSSFGKSVILEEGAVVKNSVVWDGVRVKAKSRIDTCIVTDGVVVNGNYYRQILTPTGIWKF